MQDLKFCLRKQFIKWKYTNLRSLNMELFILLSSKLIRISTNDVFDIEIYIEFNEPTIFPFH